jgi:SAM-dependent methyltransferase
MPAHNGRKEKTKAWWSAEAERRVSEGIPRTDWSSSPLIDRMINKRVTGVETRNWLGWVKEKYLKEPAGLGLSIGCGTGLLERDALDQGLCREMEGVDIAASALEIARGKAGGLPVTYRQMDLEADRLPPGRYDIVFSAGALHHINRLDFCVEQLHASLKEDGLLVLNEYTGPCRFQWEARQLKLVFEIYGFLPWRYRCNYLASGTVPYPQRPEICSMVADDPSEAVRSSEMLDVVERYFERIDRRKIGGTLLNPFLSGILENFDEEDELDRSFISLVAMLEESLIQGGAAPSDFVVDVYRRRPSPEGGEQAKDADRARSEWVSSQERAIEVALGGLGEVRCLNDTLRERIEETRRDALGAGAEAASLQRENAALKTGVIFRGAGVFKSITKGMAQVKEDVPDHCAGQAASAPALVDTSCGLISPETRAIKNHLDRLGSGNQILWLRWLREVARLACDRALMVGLEPGCAEVALRLGICRSADLVEVPVLAGVAKTSGKYDILFIGIPPCAGNVKLAGLARDLLAEEGVLVVAAQASGPSGPAGEVVERLASSLPPGWGGALDRWAQPGQAGPALDEMESALFEWFTLERSKGFGSLANKAIADVLPRVPQRDEAMSRALAGLLVYCESSLIENGLLPRALELRVYRKGAQSAGVERKKYSVHSQDILLLQEREMDRLQSLIDREKLERERLEKELQVEVQNMERVAGDLEWLRTERSLLEKRGPLKYVGLLLARRQWVKSGGRRS